MTAPPDSFQKFSLLWPMALWPAQPRNSFRFEGLTIAAAVLAECSHFNRFAALYTPIPTHPRADGVVGPFDVGISLERSTQSSPTSQRCRSLRLASSRPAFIRGLSTRFLSRRSPGRAISVTSAAAKVHGLGGAVLPPGTLRIGPGVATRQRRHGADGRKFLAHGGTSGRRGP